MNATPYLLEAGTPDGCAFRRKTFHIFSRVITASTVVAMLGTILYLIFALASMYHGSRDFDWLLGIFSDFVVIMDYALEESPYLVEGSSYPPLAIFILYPFALICKGVFAKYCDLTLTADELTSLVILTPQFWIALILFFLVTTTLVVFLLYRLFPVRRRDMIPFVSVIIFSAPFVYAIMRGNTIYFALIFLLLFLWLHESSSPLLREISYVCLALAGAIKIYPLFFGVFLLKKRKWLPALRVGLYTAVLFFVPFALLESGLSDLLPFLDNLNGFANNTLRLGATNNLSPSALIFQLLSLFGLSYTVVYDVCMVLILSVIFLVGTYDALRTNDRLSRYIICFAVVTLIPSVSYFYTIVFAIIPFMEFIRCADTLDRFRYRNYFFCFMLLLFTPLIITQFFLIQCLVILWLFAGEVYRLFKHELPARRQQQIAQ